MREGGGGGGEAAGPLGGPFPESSSVVAMAPPLQRPGPWWGREGEVGRKEVTQKCVEGPSGKGGLRGHQTRDPHQGHPRWEGEQILRRKDKPAEMVREVTEVCRGWWELQRRN